MKKFIFISLIFLFISASCQKVEDHESSEKQEQESILEIPATRTAFSDLEGYTPFLWLEAENALHDVIIAERNDTVKIKLAFVADRHINRLPLHVQVDANAYGVSYRLRGWAIPTDPYEYYYYPGDLITYNLEIRMTDEIPYLNGYTMSIILYDGAALSAAAGAVRLNVK